MKKSIIIIRSVLLVILAFVLWSFCYEKSLTSLEIEENASQTDKIEAIDKWIAELQDKRKFNGGVLIAKDGKPLLKKTYGFTDASMTTRLNESSMFRLASLSKQFTAMGIMILKEKGLLDFDDKVAQHIPDLPYKDITIRHLLNHTSGIADNYMDLYDEDDMGVLNNQKAVDLVIKKNQKAPHQPNEEYSYSNTGYIMATRVIEVVSKMSLEDFLDQELFTPAGMKESRIWNLESSDTTFPNKTNSFHFNGSKAVALLPTGIDGVAGDGAVFSSLNDFLIWDQFLYENDIVSHSTLQEAFKTPTLLNGEKSTYGFGWGVKDEIVSHTGSWLGARTIIRRNTENKSCIVILDNSAGNNVNRIMDKVVEVLKGK